MISIDDIFTKATGKNIDNLIGSETSCLKDYYNTFDYINDEGIDGDKYAIVLSMYKVLADQSGNSNDAMLTINKPLMRFIKQFERPIEKYDAMEFLFDLCKTYSIANRESATQNYNHKGFLYSVDKLSSMMKKVEDNKKREYLRFFDELININKINNPEYVKETAYGIKNKKKIEFLINSMKNKYLENFESIVKYANDLIYEYKIEKKILNGIRTYKILPFEAVSRKV